MPSESISRRKLRYVQWLNIARARARTHTHTHTHTHTIVPKHNTKNDSMPNTTIVFHKLLKVFAHSRPGAI